MQYLYKARGVPIINLENIYQLRNVEVLTFVAHGSVDIFKLNKEYLSGDELGNRLKQGGFSPKGIEVIACRRKPGPARQSLADAIGVLVKAGNGKMMAREDGSIVVVNENTTKAYQEENPRRLM